MRTKGDLARDASLPRDISTLLLTAATELDVPMANGAGSADMITSRLCGWFTRFYERRDALDTSRGQKCYFHSLVYPSNFGQIESTSKVIGKTGRGQGNHDCRGVIVHS